MEVGTEISQKIRSAIKAKLMELGAYVDDELPDYIMVMVANKKNKSQMKTDLSLFLGANTDTFTSWLHGLLGKLQTLTVDSVKDKPESEKPKKEKKKDKNGSGGQKSKGDSTKSKKAGKEKSRKRKSSKDVVDEAPKAKAAMSETVEKENTTTEITTETMVDENQILSEESSQVAANQSDQVELEANSVQQTNVQEEVEDVRQLLVAATPGDDLAKELDAVEEEISNVKKSGALSNSKNVDTSKKVVMSNVPAASDNAHDSKTKRKVPLSVVATVSRDEDDEEYDPFNPAVGSVASVVKVTSRKASFPPSMQANRQYSSNERSPAPSHNQEDQHVIDDVSPTVNLEVVKEALSEVLEKFEFSHKRDEIGYFSHFVESSLRQLEHSAFIQAKSQILEVLASFDNETCGGGKQQPFSVKKRSNGETDLPATIPNNSIQRDVPSNVTRTAGGPERIIFSSKSNKSPVLTSTDQSSEFYRSFVSSILKPSSQQPNAEGNNLSTPDGSNTPTQPLVSSTKVEFESPRAGLSACSNKSKISTLSKPAHAPSQSSATSTSLGQSAIISKECSADPGFHRLRSQILVDSLHVRRRPDPAASSLSSPVLQHAWKKRPAGEKNEGDPCVEESGTNSPSSLSPLHYSGEALKVLAKNLRVTIINRQAKGVEESSSTSGEDTSSDDDSDEEDSSDTNKEAEETTEDPGNTQHSLDTQRALLVKAMSDAEKSVATKRKVAVTRPINRQSSPGEYSPKRKRSSSNKETASPPPYIPSRKMGASPATSSHSRGSGVVFKQKVLSQDDIRHTLGRDGSRSLLSASRRQELGRKTVNENSAPSYHSTPSFHKRSTKDAEGSKSKTSSLDGGAHSREVKSLEKMSGEVKNFQITARVGPLQSAPSKENTPETVESDSDEGLRVTVISGQGGKVSSQLDSVPVSAVKKSQTLSRSSDKTRSAVGTIKKSKQRENLLTENKSRGVRVISKLAREAVQKQCKAAVMSVTKATSVSTRASSPDSRVVQCDSKPPSVDSEQEEGSDANEPQDEDISASEDSDTKVVIQKSPTPSVSPDKVIPIVSPTRRQSIKKDVEEVEDLSQMLEEDLDNELLLEEEDKNEFTLDLDDEELSHVVEEVAAEIEPQPEKDESKSGIRFIVTLDGIDEARFDDKSSKSVTNVAGAQAIRPMNTNPSPSHNQLVTTLPPSTPTRPLLPAAVTSPQLTSTPAQVANKIRPPKIQPFSISLRDSDDEHEEKVVTYIQASDAAALESTGGREPSVLQQARSQERCRYWPACMAGSDCQYHHPTTHCKTFPNCKFGDKCLFIHPNCKFDSKCVRADCPFTHTSKRHVSQLVAPTMPPSRIYPRYPSVPHTHHQAATCHFFPNCLNPNCTFVHPKPCMYGLACKNPTCTFYHPAQVSPPIVTSTVPDKKKLKWQAQQTTQLKVAAVKPSATRSATVSSTSL